jgi:hypothetical protein
MVVLRLWIVVIVVVVLVNAATTDTIFPILVLAFPTRTPVVVRIPPLPQRVSTFYSISSSSSLSSSVVHRTTTRRRAIRPNTNNNIVDTDNDHEDLVDINGSHPHGTTSMTTTTTTTMCHNTTTTELIANTTNTITTNSSSSSSSSSKREMLAFAIPALGIYLCNPLLSNIDNAFVGQTMGTIGLAALSPATICIDQMLYLFNFLGRATTGMVSRAYGTTTASNGNDTSALHSVGNTMAARDAASART